jgi:hypothetical protein
MNGDWNRAPQEGNATRDRQATGLSDSAAQGQDRRSGHKGESSTPKAVPRDTA